MQAAVTDVASLETRGFVHISGPFPSIAAAWNAAGSLIDAAAANDAPLDIVGDFVIPPSGGAPSREFQTLHHDFGLPLAVAGLADIARFTALHITVETPASEAVTRLVHLRALLAEHAWPDRDELVRRFRAYGDSHGAWADTGGYIEGSLARVVEAALGQTPVLPSVKNPGFLCGTEFASLAAEREFFRSRGLPIDALEGEIRLQPGELLIFDNLMLAHGRRGARQPGELHQRIFGHRSLTVDRQIGLLARVLADFAREPAEMSEAAR